LALAVSGGVQQNHSPGNVTADSNLT